MAVKAGTIVGVTHVYRNFTGIGSLNMAFVAVNFPAYTATTDSFSIAGVGAAIETFSKRGKTNTLKSAFVVAPGKDSAGTACYPTDTTVAGALTVSTDALTGGLKAANLSTEVTMTTGGTVTPATIAVVYSEA